jgi:p-cumate 2,3-dioxygenase alpha subunit
MSLSSPSSGLLPAEKQCVARLVEEDRAIHRFRVNRRVFVDSAILALDRSVIFNRCWLYLGHESEVADEGSFVTRTVGGRQLIFNRDRGGSFNALYNSCSHRGAMVCWEKRGKTKLFFCPYHGWSFDERGKLKAIPKAEALDPRLYENGEFDLKRVIRIESYRGFVFVNFDDNAESLTDYLADAKDVIDVVADQGERGMEIVPGSHEYGINANWKLLAENSVDAYHAKTTHATYFDFLRQRDRPQKDAPRRPLHSTPDLGNGHLVEEREMPSGWGRPYAKWVPGYGEEAREEIEAIRAALIERLGNERGTRVAQIDRNCLIFPNLVINDVMAVLVRTFYPVRPDRMDVSAWMIAPVGESPSSRERRFRSFLEFLGPAGFATPDDVEMLGRCQLSYANIAVAEWHELSRGMMRDTGWPLDEEEQQRVFWRRWRDLLEGTDGEGR